MTLSKDQRVQLSSLADDIGNLAAKISNPIERKTFYHIGLLLSDLAYYTDPAKLILADEKIKETLMECMDWYDQGLPSFEGGN
jgi:hypothetical protein